MARAAKHQPAIFLLICVLLASGNLGGQARPIRRVLILNEAGTSHPLINLADEGIRTTFANSPYRIEFLREYMETILFPDPADQQRIRDFIIRKYRDHQPDVIITVGSSPAKFMLEAHKESFPGVPVVFAYPNAPADSPLTLDADTTAVEGDLSPARTVDAALRLLPDTVHVAVVTGVSPYDIHWRTVIRQELRPYERRLDISDLTDLTFPSLLERLKHSPSHTIVLLGPYGRDTSGATYTSAEIGPMAVGASNAPVFTLSDRLMGHGEIGGDLSSAVEQGKLAAGLAMRMLNGERNLAPVRESTTYMFDWRALKRWGMNEKNLPPGSIVLNRDIGTWEAYKRYLIIGILVFLAQAVAILGLLWQRARRRRTEAELKRSEEKFSKSFRQSPLAITIARASDGRYVDVNETFEERTGWKRDEVIGHTPLEIGIWSDPTQRSQFLKQVETEGSVRNLEVRYRRKDGELRTSLGSAELIRVGGESCILSVIADITDRKLAEDALRSLSGQLIKAQEQERSRIAREIHDDYQQRLAKMAIDLEGVAQKLGGETEVSEELHELWNQVGELGSDLHSLSHRLHSSTLDSLGLVAGLRALCAEFQDYHSIAVEFQEEHVSRSIPGEIALCLFRITQEALQNVRKHSRADSALVRVTGSEQQIHLSISDRGLGFDPSSLAQQGGIGIRSMEERVRLVGGELAIHSRPMEGTRIDVWAPI